MASFTREQLEKWVKEIDVKADRVIDVGGSQYPIKNRTKSWDVKDYKILDLKEPHVCVQKPDYEFDLNKKINLYLLLGSELPFDVAFCLEVSEYLWNPYQALKNISELLKNGGLLYISFHFIYPHHNPEGEDYLRYTKWGVIKLLKETGFGIEKITPRVEGGYLIQRGGIRMKNNNVRVAAFYAREKMRPYKDFKEHHAVGWLVKAKKITN